MKKFVMLLTAIATLFFLNACGKETAKATTEETTTTSQTAVEVTDNQGHKETFTSVPEKVVVFDAGALDTLDALGLKEKVAGAATKSLPGYLNTYEKVPSAGGIKEPDLEKINAIKPDLILISGRQSDFYEELDKLAPTLYVGLDSTRPWESLVENAELLGKIFQKETQVQEKLATLKTNAENLSKKAQATGEKSLVVLLNEGQLSAYGPHSRFGLIHDIFGFAPADETIEASTHGQSVSYEYLLEKNPDILFVIDRTQAIGGDTSKNNLMENPLVLKTKAGKNQKVITLDPSLWYLSGGGLESFQLMMEDVTQALN